MKKLIVMALFFGVFFLSLALVNTLRAEGVYSTDENKVMGSGAASFKPVGVMAPIDPDIRFGPVAPKLIAKPIGPIGPISTTKPTGVMAPIDPDIRFGPVAPKLIAKPIGPIGPISTRKPDEKLHKKVEPTPHWLPKELPAGYEIIVPTGTKVPKGYGSVEFNTALLKDASKHLGGKVAYGLENLLVAFIPEGGNMTVKFYDKHGNLLGSETTSSRLGSNTITTTWYDAKGKQIGDPIVTTINLPVVGPITVTPVGDLEKTGKN